jgi:chromosome partitioning protein
MTEIDKDLDIAIGHYAELLTSNLHTQGAAHFPPEAKKMMRSLTSGEAAELPGVDHTYLRKLHREGKIAEVETTAGTGMGRLVPNRRLPEPFGS